MLGLNIESLTKYPYQKGVKGINFAQIEKPSQIIRSESGRELMVAVVSIGVSVTDLSGFSGVELKMCATAYSGQISYGLFSRIFTYSSGKLGDRHPDFNPYEFARCALDFLDQSSESPVTSLRSDWNSHSYSAWQYWKLRTEETNPMSKEDSARHTWGGKLAHSLGFGNIIGEVDESLGANVAVIWSRDLD